MSDQVELSAHLKMQVKRMLSRVFNSLGRNNLKKCSFRKVISILGTGLLAWTGFLLLSTPGIFQQFRQRASKSSLELSSGDNNRQNDFDINGKSVSESVNDHVFLYDYLIQDNPLGTYFSDRLGGNTPIGDSHLDFYYKKEHHKPLKMVLIFVEDTTSSSVVVLGKFFASQRIEYRFRSVSKELPPLFVEDLGLPRYSLFVFDEFISYIGMQAVQRGILDDYCRKYKVGILAMTQSSKNAEIEFFSDTKLKFQHRMKLVKYKLNPETNIWRVAKPQEVYAEALPSSDWTIFLTDHETYQPLVFSTVASDWQGSTGDVRLTEFGCTVAVLDRGFIDGIQKVILGYDLDFWPNSIVAMDAVTYLTNGKLSLPLTRLLQVDVDDMFVGASGIRTQVKDAVAMAESQKKIRKYVPGFSYTLGFSGEFYMKGNPAEQEGDRKIVELADQFVWFNHMHRHEQPHQFDQAKLKSSMNKNDQFALEHKIPQLKDYMVTPHHSGVYPVYEALYNEWNERGVTCASTTEYPRDIPLWGRRGFVYRGVKVLPRQICNLFTTINRFEDYKGGKSSLDSSIRGDFLFKLFLTTPVLIFMTHMSNYANDQLAQYTFENVTKFVTKWTNLQLEAPPPSEIARRYFEMYPNEVTPIWGNPCDYYKHMEILPLHVSCAKFPQFIIVGPQKSGTAALQKFLEEHPMLVSTIEDPVHFEEVQFFSGSSYLNGLDWYQNHFPEPATENVILFEKSANYFDSEITPKRMFSLVPRAKIIIILAEPIRRAYSWYQHIKSHKEPVTLNYTFFEIISAPDTAPKLLRDARNKCLKAGAYAIHLARWLQYFPREQIYLVDGDQMSKNPVPVLNQLQKFLNVTPFIDFATKLRFDPVKGFYCRREGGCLGSTKGRKYLPMDPESRQYLEDYFQTHNTNLKIMLNHIGQDFPQWLTETELH